MIQEKKGQMAQFFIEWWAGQGSNLRRPACKASALPLSYPPKVPASMTPTA